MTTNTEITQELLDAVTEQLKKLIANMQRINKAVEKLNLEVLKIHEGDIGFKKSSALNVKVRERLLKRGWKECCTDKAEEIFEDKRLKQWYDKEEDKSK